MGDGMLSVFGSFGFDNVSEDEMDIGGFGVGEEFVSKLKMDLLVVIGCKERWGLFMILLSYLVVLVIRIMLFLLEIDLLIVVIMCIILRFVIR